MKIVQHTKDINKPFGATLGNFDGVHKGHLSMLKEAKQKCVESNISFAVITFLPHPAQILKAQRAFLLSEYEDRRSLLENAGVDILVEIPFTREFSSLTPEQFIDAYISSIKNLKLLCLGYDFAFGANKAGDVNTFRQILSGSNLSIVELSQFQESDQRISSSVIRELIRKGRVEDVKNLLGRNYRLKGKVVRGKGRGKGIGFPTANLQVPDEMITPSTGVYATQTVLGHKTYKSVTNIGFNPTFNDSLKMTIETHILDSIDDFYNEILEVEFLGKIREEKRFNSIDDLISQIAKDAKVAKEWK